MSTDTNLDIIKALADKSRLAIVQSLLERPHYVEELAERHALAPSTISFHLRKLEQAGLVTSRKEQYYVVVEANQPVFDTSLRALITATPRSREEQQQRVAAYRRKVLETFFRGGRLEKLPAQHKKRLIVLQVFAARFERQQRYDEDEVTELILPLYDDYCTVRRLLVDEGLIRREGASYWRDAELEMETPELPAKDGKGSQANMESRKEIKRTYKESQPRMGIFALRCKSNGKRYVAASRNLEGERNSRLFQLRMGKVVFSRELQQDLQQYGAADFAFEVLAVLEPQRAGEDVDRELAALELKWLEKLQPFGENGYNNRRRFERDRERLSLSGYQTA